MKEKLKEKGLALRAQAEELKQVWTEYVKQQGEVDLKGYYITMTDGSGERMSKMLYRDGEVFLKDVFGCEWRFPDDFGYEALDALHCFMFEKRPDDEE